MIVDTHSVRKMLDSSIKNSRDVSNKIYKIKPDFKQKNKKVLINKSRITSFKSKSDVNKK